MRPERGVAVERQRVADRDEVRDHHVGFRHALAAAAEFLGDLVAHVVFLAGRIEIVDGRQHARPVGVLAAAPPAPADPIAIPAPHILVVAHHFAQDLCHFADAGSGGYFVCGSGLNAGSAVGFRLTFREGIGAGLILVLRAVEHPAIGHAPAVMRTVVRLPARAAEAAAPAQGFLVLRDSAFRIGAALAGIAAGMGDAGEDEQESGRGENLPRLPHIS